MQRQRNMTSANMTIPIPAGTFQRAEAVAQALNVPRSELYVQALEKYLRQCENKRLREQINATYADGLTPEEDQLLAATRRYHRNRLENEWEN